MESLSKHFVYKCPVAVPSKARLVIKPKLNTNLMLDKVKVSCSCCVSTAVPANSISNSNSNFLIITFHFR